MVKLAACLHTLYRSSFFFFSRKQKKKKRYFFWNKFLFSVSIIAVPFSLCQLRVFNNVISFVYTLFILSTSSLFCVSLMSSSMEIFHDSYRFLMDVGCSLYFYIQYNSAFFFLQWFLSLMRVSWLTIMSLVQINFGILFAFLM